MTSTERQPEAKKPAAQPDEPTSQSEVGASGEQSGGAAPTLSLNQCDCEQFPCEHTSFARRLGMGAGIQIRGPEVEFDAATTERLLALFKRFDEARRAAWAAARDHWLS